MQVKLAPFAHLGCHVIGCMHARLVHLRDTAENRPLFPHAHGAHIGRKPSTPHRGVAILPALHQLLDSVFQRLRPRLVLPVVSPVKELDEGDAALWVVWQETPARAGRSAQ